MEKQNIKELNSQLPNCRTLYEVLVDNKGYYLPKWQSHSCTVEYLLELVKNEKIFRVKRSEISRPPIIKQKKTVEELIDMVEELLKKKNLNLGFKGERKPDKEWIINILHHLDPKNPIFHFEEDKLTREFPKEK